MCHIHEVQELSDEMFYYRLNSGNVEMSNRDYLLLLFPQLANFDGSLIDGENWADTMELYESLYGDSFEMS